MLVKNLDWLRQRVAWLVRFDVTMPDEAFAGPQSNPYLRIDEAINETYKIIIFDAANGIDPDFFKVSSQFIWPANQVQFTLPAGLSRISALDWRIITNGLPGQQITPTAGYTFTSEIYWSGGNTLSWGNTGPRVDEIVLCTHRALPTDMSAFAEEPHLLTYEFRDMLPIGAAIWLLTQRVGDEAPQSLIKQFADWTWRFHCAVEQAAAASGSYTDMVPVAVLPFGR